MEFGPSHQREDLRYGDPHYKRGRHPFYGPDPYDLKKDGKEPLESHGFYMPEPNAGRPRLLGQLKRLFHSR